MDLFDVYVARFQVSEERAVRGLMRVFGMSEASARIFYRSLPRMGKRAVPLMAAEHYVRALSSVGAVSECRPSQAITTRSQPPPNVDTSLPPPGSSLPPSSHAEPLGSTSSSGFVRFGAQMPTIPPAAPLPRELGGVILPGREAELALSGLDTADVFLGERTPAPEGASIPVRDSAARAIRPEHVGMATSYAPNPGSSRPPTYGRAPSGSSSRDPWRTPWYLRRSVLVVFLLGALGALGYALRDHYFETEASRLEAAWRDARIAFGDYEDLTRFVSDPERGFAQTSNAEADLLFDGLKRAGARRMWAVNIEEVDDTRRSRGVLVELPDDEGARRTIFFQHAPLSQTRPVPTDRGQRYLLLAL